MQATTSAPLLPAAAATGDCIKRLDPTGDSVASKSVGRLRRAATKSHRLLLRQARGGGSRLVGNFSEFLSQQRNVINRSALNRYDKIVSSSSSSGGEQVCINDTSSSRLEWRVPVVETASFLDASHSFHQAPTPEDLRLPLKYNSSNSSSDRKHRLASSGFSNHQHQYLGKKSSHSRALLLLRALLSPRQRNKASLLVSLLRAPVVLAALFSLVLIASLLVLYTLSFAHHLAQYHRGHTMAAGELEDLQQAPAADQDVNRQQQQQHRINSRQLALADDANRAEKDAAAGLERALTVQTECGAFVGEPEDRAIVFRGIAYASPPLGARRWARPRPVWLDAGLCRRDNVSRSAWRPHCAQLSPVTRRFSGHEDCLYLDIYSPKLDQVKKLPVMVYIHGGFLAFGSSGQGQVNWMRGRPSGQLAAELNVVVVAINYRLQALGFMTLAQLASRSNGPDGSDEGNYGLWDQLAALTWIKRNIEPFAGDPNNIVLFGPDSSSALPLALLSGGGGDDDDDDDSGDQQDSELQYDSLRPDRRQSGQRPLTTASDAPASSWLYSRDLFRAVWLTNPTVYYELPSELANQHYRRLFLRSQAPCGSSNASHSAPALECLMSLSGEQVVRQYLGQDDPSYRLDDQNSMPIHGVFADQFVTVDRELVLDSYPFGGANETFASAAAVAAKECANCTTSRKGANRHHQWAAKRRGAKDLLVGSTAQAVEYWPCPRNLASWSWDDFKRYVATSLNSFARDTYKRAGELYGWQIESPAVAAIGGGLANEQAPLQRRMEAGPKETYLNMVTDIRQVCPINELSDSLAARGHRVQRYVVETAPTGKWSSSSPSNDPSVPYGEQLHSNHRPEFAYHTWDLLAFFGFQFEPDFLPSETDLKFQTELRSMVRKFVHGTTRNEGHNSSTDGETRYTRFTRQAGVMIETGAHKLDECAMWRGHLGRSYAWVS